MKIPTAPLAALNIPDIQSNLTGPTGSNPRYSFQNFVVGPCNMFAYEAALTVANEPGEKYNPLLICGGHGLGKTHLLKAMANHIIQNNPSSRVRYVSSERFLSDLIECLINEEMVDFRNKYRKIDVLLFDDIQFLAARERTLEEFLNTFDSLYDCGKQMVMACDARPKEIPSLFDRLRCHMSGSVEMGIQAPETETKAAILRKNADSNGVCLPGDVLGYLAVNLGPDIRELEGAVTRLRAWSSLAGKEINLRAAGHILQDIVRRR